ncbi:MULTISPECIES: hypothetical protein [Pseudoalteromonas]|uniref:hypothetical protein n=1 Tax=Pseudoalteromonas TaxID=53246 RepID=UPI001020385B|nr:hypothetical protein [Pseudoalteromonas sp. MEBiC 03485]RZD19726.1 hypothetical protein EVU92_21220 [Pseudoalteromonas sp. MEBiC 03485]
MQNFVSQNKHNTFFLLDMDFKDLVCVDPDYENPESEFAIQWIRRHSSFYHVDNKCHDAGGVYDFIFNLNMLETFILESSEDELNPMFEQLAAIQAAGYNYILFNQGC